VLVLFLFQPESFQLLELVGRQHLLGGLLLLLSEGVDLLLQLVDLLLVLSAGLVDSLFLFVGEAELLVVGRQLALYLLVLVLVLVFLVLVVLGGLVLAVFVFVLGLDRGGAGEQDGDQQQGERAQVRHGGAPRQGVGKETASPVTDFLRRSKKIVARFFARW